MRSPYPTPTVPVGRAVFSARMISSCGIEHLLDALREVRECLDLVFGRLWHEDTYASYSIPRIMYS